MLGVERLAGAVVWCWLVVLNWFNAQFLHPLVNWWLDSVLGTWEESTKSLLREVCAQSIRGLDLVVNALFGWFPGFQSTKTTFERPSGMLCAMRYTSHVDLASSGISMSRYCVVIGISLAVLVGRGSSKHIQRDHRP